MQIIQQIKVCCHCWNCFQSFKFYLRSYTLYTYTLTRRRRRTMGTYRCHNYENVFFSPSNFIYVHTIHVHAAPWALRYIWGSYHEQVYERRSNALLSVLWLRRYQTSATYTSIVQRLRMRPQSVQSSIIY